MNIISNFADDVRSEKARPGSYEWWYFDAISENGYQIVVIFYDGNPFSRRYIEKLSSTAEAAASDFPALSISVYKDGRPVYYSFAETHEERAEFSDAMPKGRVGNSRFEGSFDDGVMNYRLILDQSLDSGDSIKAEFSFSNPDPSFESLNGDKNPAGERHSWNLVMPMCTVNGHIEIKGFDKLEAEFIGTGYHDHNIGSEPMKDSFYEWYWGRYHTTDSTFIYYLMNRFGTWEKRAWIIGRNGQVTPSLDIAMEGEMFSIFGLKSSRILKFGFSDRELFLQLDHVMDNGPFYQRFMGRLLLGSDKSILSNRGISEYIRPARIYSRFFWPLVDMRIRYPGHVHWVQKNPRLYRWTW